MKRKRPSTQLRWQKPTRVAEAAATPNVDHWFHNPDYQIGLKRLVLDWFGARQVVFHVSVKAISPGMRPVTWEILQLAKNDLVGEGCEGFELYPSERRKAETPIRHLFVFEDRSVRIPVGFGLEVPVDG